MGTNGGRGLQEQHVGRCRSGTVLVWAGEGSDRQAEREVGG